MKEITISLDQDDPDRLEEYPSTSLMSSSPWRATHSYIVESAPSSVWPENNRGVHLVLGEDGFKAYQIPPKRHIKRHLVLMPVTSMSKFSSIANLAL